MEVLKFDAFKVCSGPASFRMDCSIPSANMVFMQSAVDLTFWAQLNNLKLQTWRLSEEPVQIHGVLLKTHLEAFVEPICAHPASVVHAVPPGTSRLLLTSGLT